jgi:hypothetical protein
MGENKLKDSRCQIFPSHYLFLYKFQSQQEFWSDGERSVVGQLGEIERQRNKETERHRWQ